MAADGSQHREIGFLEFRRCFSNMCKKCVQIQIRVVYWITFLCLNVLSIISVLVSVMSNVSFFCQFGQMALFKNNKICNNS